MAQAKISNAAMQNAVELPVHLETFEAKTANNFSNSTIPIIFSGDRRTPQLTARLEVPKPGKKRITEAGNPDICEA